MDEFPHNLADLQKGDAVEGDSGVDATKPPSTSFLSIFSFSLLAFRLKSRASISKQIGWTRRSTVGVKRSSRDIH